jgi:uncharacterized membrane protein YqjE
MQEPVFTADTQAERDAQFVEWMTKESSRREVARLKQRTARLLLLQVAALVFMLFWVCIMFVGFQFRPDLVAAELAGIVTFITLFGGALIVWRLRHLTQETERRIAAEQQTLAKEAPPAP